jgi:hypothetical protein
MDEIAIRRSATLGDIAAIEGLDQGWVGPVIACINANRSLTVRESMRLH